MSGLTDYDGLCGIIHLHSGDKQIRCHYKFGHDGPCSHHDKGTIEGEVTFRGLFVHPIEKDTQVSAVEKDPTKHFPLLDPFVQKKEQQE